MKTLCRHLFATLGFAALLLAASFNFTAGAQPPAPAASGQDRCVLVAVQPPALMVTLLCR